MATSRIALTICLIISTSAAAAAQHAADFMDRTAAIAKGQDAEARRRTITDALEAAGIEYHLEGFSFSRFSGTNIIVDIPGKDASKVFLLGAHYDRVSVGQGAVDNAASCAVLLELLKEFKGSPLHNFSIQAVFFDLEEGGLVGSQAYLAGIRNKQMPADAVNLDIFGYGDTLFAAASSMDGPLAQALQRAAQKNSVQVRLVEPARYPASDHRPMISAGIETLGVALIDGAEVDPILQRSAQTPRILTIIHTPQDTTDKIRGMDIEKAFPVIVQTLREMD
jgi:Zn-dependent M28 family amino/carboxypeptidase